MNMIHLKWARQHDWGKDAYLDDGVLCGLIDAWINADGETHKSEVRFSDFREMRVWAGY